jgi:sugar (pentulose or hexulose) kinase
MEAVAVGVDAGTGGARALALDRDGAVVASAAAPYPGDAAWPPGRADANAWLSGVVDALAALAEQAPQARAPVAVGIGGQSPTTIDGDGERLAVTCRHPAGLDRSPTEQHYAQRAVLGVERRDDVQPHQLWDWLLQRLGAEPHQGRWPGDPDLSGYGVRRGTGEVVGAARDGLPVLAATPLVTGAQDAYLAMWAAGIDVVGRALDPGGRTGGIALAAPAGTQVAGLWAFQSAARGVDIVGGPVNAHGLAVEWLSTVTGRSVAELLHLASDAPPGANGVMLLPYLNGERAPRWNPALRAELTGVSAQTTVADLARATLEATAYGLAHVAMVLRSGGAQIDSLVCSGTPARSALWCRIKAAVLEAPVDVPAESDLAAYGAALAAGAGAGWWPKPGEGGSGAWPRPRMQRIEPQVCPAYREGLQRFIELGDAAEQRLAAQGEH